MKLMFQEQPTFFLVLQISNLMTVNSNITYFQTIQNILFTRIK